MDLVYSVALLGLAVILFVVLMLGDRKPDRPGWASEGMANDLTSVAITALIAVGICYGVKFGMTIGEQKLGPTAFILLALTLAACVVTLRTLAPRRRLAEYAAQHALKASISELPQVSVVTVATADPNNDQPSGPTLPRAA